MLDCNHIQTHGGVIDQCSSSLNCFKTSIVSFPHGNPDHVQKLSIQLRNVRFLEVYDWLAGNPYRTYRKAFMESFVPTLQNLEGITIEIADDAFEIGNRLYFPLSADECKRILPRSIPDSSLCLLLANNPRLKKVKICVPDSFCESLEWVRECFPLMGENGLLEVCFRKL
ncbi:hypothetical protein VKT23_008112 [Stygiomarasmius scandens]|uniref:FBD domain-containing protein n=1 Tax=Marasmiellus scandens TaxID=2682957 RepID=A0ABR1JHB3_9AGAR